MLVPGAGGFLPLTGGAGSLALFNAGRAVSTVSVQGGIIRHLWSPRTAPDPGPHHLMTEVLVNYCLLTGKSCHVGHVEMLLLSTADSPVVTLCACWGY